MKKIIVSYDKKMGIVIDCIQINTLNENEHIEARKEVSEMGFEFNSIDADSFRATYQSNELPYILFNLERLGYKF